MASRKAAHASKASTRGVAPVRPSRRVAAAANSRTCGSPATAHACSAATMRCCGNASKEPAIWSPNSSRSESTSPVAPAARRCANGAAASSARKASSALRASQQAARRKEANSRSVLGRFQEDNSRWKALPAGWASCPSMATSGRACVEATPSGTANAVCVPVPLQSASHGVPASMAPMRSMSAAPRLCNAVANTVRARPGRLMKRPGIPRMA
mmetsp:Transcript_116091/g.375088  ORF Transcript_116091/g.375088 Transcript_116091/m.375088 type:complete len:213 (+) Transcript_116091:1008-1646(+)